MVESQFQCGDARFGHVEKILDLQEFQYVVLCPFHLEVRPQRRDGGTSGGPIIFPSHGGEAARRRQRQSEWVDAYDPPAEGTVGAVAARDNIDVQTLLDAVA
jgi:hypothetical protein